jgi:hypothetical protein
MAPALAAVVVTAELGESPTVAFAEWDQGECGCELSTLIPDLVGVMS